VGRVSTARIAADDVRVARAYLSRVAEPASLAVWELVERVGPIEAAQIIQDAKGSKTVSAATAPRRELLAQDDLDSAERHGIALITPEDGQWPHFALAPVAAAARSRWLSWSAGDRAVRAAGEMVPPLALWIRGSLDPAHLGIRSAAIIGARAATGYGLHVASELAYGLAARGAGVVSGGAFGIDAAAHRGALAAGGETVLVSAGGLDRAYPLAHASLFEQVAEHGLLISESPPGSAPYRRRFLSRNRLIAALSGGTVVVEAGRRSGSLNTAAHARRLGRPLMVVPGPITSAMSIGCHDLLRGLRVGDMAEVRLVTGVDDVLAEIGEAGEGLRTSEAESASPSARPEQAGDASAQRRLDSLDPVAGAVYDALRPRRWSTEDELSVASGESIAAVRQALAALLVFDLAESGPEGHRVRSGAAG
jgi:DNA processing protein